jgi:hypothetical protein
MIRSAKDLWAGIIYIFFGVSAIFIARSYTLGTAFRMGPAYFPIVLSILLIGIGAVSVIRAFIVPGTTNRIHLSTGYRITPHERTIMTIVRSCVDWKTSDPDGWHPVKADVVFAVPNDVDSFRGDVSKWSLITFNLTNAPAQ